MLLLLISATAIVIFFLFFFVHYSLNPSDSKEEVFLLPVLTKNINKNNITRKPILPKHIILVTGLESSGTKYISSAIATATEAVRGIESIGHSLRNYHDRVGGVDSPNQVEVIHQSLPHGAWCTIFGKQLENMTSNNLTNFFESWTVPFIPPKQCECGRDLIEDFMHMQARKRKLSNVRETLRSKVNELGNIKEYNRMMKLHAKYKEEGNKHRLEDEALSKIRALFKSSGECNLWKEHASSSEENCAALGINKPIESPPRRFVNISSHVKWYQQHGVRATAVIVVRDQTIESISKYNDHCHDKKIVIAENEYGKKVIRDALNNLSQEGPTPTLVLVSFEALVMFGRKYLKTLIYPKLGINMTKNISIPPIRDSNNPYIIKNTMEQ